MSNCDHDCACHLTFPEGTVLFDTEVGKALLASLEARNTKIMDIHEIGEAFPVVTSIQIEEAFKTLGALGIQVLG